MRLRLFLINCAAILLAGCQGWTMDYGQPAEQFLEKDLFANGEAYLGKKITVKGTVTKVLIGPGELKVFLQHGIECRFGKFKKMAKSCKVGDEVFVDGILKRLEEGEALLDPSIFRDPNAEFTPLRK
ncbi:hypothetical protein OAG39_02440 [Verrucomicrobiales bacterium]|nr:hypothetical protein [Verrucomicrobiales bacterium]